MAGQAHRTIVYIDDCSSDFRMNQSVNSGALKCAMQPGSEPAGQARSPLIR
jgi:hypothetical protein